MDAFTHVVTSMPWYGWVAIIAIVSGAAVKLMVGCRRDTPGGG